MVLSPAAKKGRRMLAALLLVVALFVAGTYFYVQHRAREAVVGQTPVALAARGEAIALPQAVAETEMLYYYDDLYGFELKYPAGYRADVDPDFGVRLRFTANNPFSSYDKILSAEVIDVGVNEQLSVEEVAANAFEGVEGHSLNQTSVRGKRVWIGSGETRGFVEQDERIFLHGAFFNCVKEDGAPYVAALMAAIPESLQQDSLVFNYMVATFNCTK